MKPSALTLAAAATIAFIGVAVAAPSQPSLYVCISTEEDHWICDGAPDPGDRSPLRPAIAG